MTEIGYFFITGKTVIRLQFIFNRRVSHSHTQFLKCLCTIWVDVYTVNAHFQDLCLDWKWAAVLTKPGFQSHTEKTQGFMQMCKIWQGKKRRQKVFFQYTPLMSWGEICIAWWLRNPGNYLGAPQGLICDEYRRRDNASQSIPVWECQWEQPLPWFKVSDLLTHDFTSDFMDNFIVSSPRTSSSNADLILITGDFSSSNVLQMGCVPL